MSTDITVIIVGLGQWDTFTKRAIDSIRYHEQDLRIVVMDIGGSYPAKYDGAEIVVLRDSPSYAYAINCGVEYAKESDWYLILNNDVFLKDRITPIIELCDPNKIYGRQIITENGHVWLGLWLALISRKTFETVGAFDENYLVCGFEDADYCIRAKMLGIDTEHVPLPFHHYWGKTRWGIPSYPTIREANIDYFESKWGWRAGCNLRVIHD